MAERPAAVLLVLAPSGQRSRVALDSMPFSIGRQSGNSLVLRDNRTSRNHCRIVFENGSYAIEDLNSRHGTFVNGKQISRHVLHNSDRIEFGVRDSYQLTFSAEQQDIQRLLGQFGSVVASAGEASGAGNLIKLRSLVEVARAVAPRPKVLLLDEPSAGLNEAESRKLGETLAQFVAASGTTIMLVEHHIELVSSICAFVYVLEFGQLIAAGTPAAVRSSEAVQEAYLGRRHNVPSA